MSERRDEQMSGKGISVILYSFSFSDANSICILKLLQHMVFRGQKVCLICYKIGVSDYSKLSNLGIEISHYSGCRFSRKEQCEDSNGFFALGRTVSRFVNAVANHTIYRRHPMKAVLSRSFVSYAVESICTAGTQAILSVSHPFINHVAASMVKRRMPTLWWAAYELDPYTYNYNLPEKEIALRGECELSTFLEVDRLILTKGIWEENVRNNFGAQLQAKVQSVPLPNLEIEGFISIEHNLLNIDSHKINLLFAGNVYGSFRNPRAMLDIIFRINAPDVVLHIYGEGMERLVQEYGFSDEQVVLHGRVDHETILNAMAASSVLINLGNSMPNQTPSKVFEYISTGKPIVNFAFSESDTSLAYLKRYPLHLTIIDKGVNSEVEAQQFLKFCRKYRNSSISPRELRELYNELLSPSVCETIAALLDPQL